MFFKTSDFEDADMQSEMVPDVDSSIVDGNIRSVRG